MGSLWIENRKNAISIEPACFPTKACSLSPALPGARGRDQESSLSRLPAKERRLPSVSRFLDSRSDN